MRKRNRRRLKFQSIEKFQEDWSLDDNIETTTKKNFPTKGPEPRATTVREDSTGCSSRNSCWSSKQKIDLQIFHMISGFDRCLFNQAQQRKAVRTIEMSEDSNKRKEMESPADSSSKKPRPPPGFASSSALVLATDRSEPSKQNALIAADGATGVGCTCMLCSISKK